MILDWLKQHLGDRHLDVDERLEEATRKAEEIQQRGDRIVRGIEQARRSRDPYSGTVRKIARGE